MVLEKFIQLSSRVASRILSCVEDHPGQNNFYPLLHRPENVSPSEPIPEPMQVETTKLSLSERQRWLSQGLCLYCGASGHVISTCPIHPPRCLVSAHIPSPTNIKPLTTNALIMVSDVSLPVNALLDSGSSGNFISGTLSRQLNLPTTTNKTIYQIISITERPLSRKNVRLSVGPLKLRVDNLHEETIHLLVLEDSTADVILGRPWLVQHNPILSWKSGEILKWGESCFPDCFPQRPHPPNHIPKRLIIFPNVESPRENQSVDIPSSYTPFSDVFCPKRASKLPPHRPWDCAIDRLPGESVPRGRIYPLSIPEQKAMEEYIEEALQQGSGL